MLGTMNILGQTSVSDFLKQYWQTKPLLIRNAIRHIQPTLDADTLAGLSLEDSVRSRIVRQIPDEDRWNCTYGPFTEDDFSTLPATHWTLLVQDVEKHLPEHAAVIEHFSFLPRWRIDDLMVSYAVDGGSVGPHIDQYDVFLLQVSGQRRWQLQTKNITESDLQINSELSILKSFQADEDWVLNPGDLLYLPPGIPHFGVAVGECMTYSIGFRAPRTADILQVFSEQLANTDDKPLRHIDSTSNTTPHRGELTNSELSRMQNILRRSLDNDDVFIKAMGSLLTEATETPSVCSNEVTTAGTFSTSLHTCSKLILHPATRCLYIRRDSGILWFVNAVRHDIGPGLATIIMQLTDDYELQNDAIMHILEDEQLIAILFGLYQEGYLQLGYQDSSLG